MKKLNTRNKFRPVYARLKFRDKEFLIYLAHGGFCDPRFPNRKQGVKAQGHLPYIQLSDLLRIKKRVDGGEFSHEELTSRLSDYTDLSRASLDYLLNENKA